MPDDRRPQADYYFVLGVPPDATETELHAAWRRQLKYWHPDLGNQWKTVSREGPPRAPKGFDRHGFVARLEQMMDRGRLMIEKRKDLASASKWEAQTQALLRDELGDHAYTKRFEVALSQPRPEGMVAAYGVLWAAYEDALKGVLKPVVKERRPS